MGSTTPSRVPLRVAVVQFAPQIGRVQENIDKAQNLCESLQPGTIDLLCLPEMIFSGYVFRSASAMAPFLEDPHTGPTATFCAATAARLRCYVAAGYAERLAPSELERGADADGTTVDLVGANSALVYAPNGAREAAYRKTHLFSVDRAWAKPGTGFATLRLPPPLGTLALGICNDLNPQAPWTGLEAGPYELADHCAGARARVLVLLNAWIDSGVEEQRAEDWATLNAWATRLWPLWHRKKRTGGGGLGGGERADGEGEDEDEDTLVLVCNRTGVEDGITFAGSSALFRLRPSARKPYLLENMGRREEGVCIWEV